MKVIPALGLLLTVTFSCLAPGYGAPTGNVSEADEEKASLLNNQAVDLADKWQNEAALKLIDQALALDPNDETIVLNRATILRDLRQLSDALNAVDAGLLKWPKSVSLREERANLLGRLRLYAEAHRQWLDLFTGNELQKMSGVPDGFLVPDAALAPRDPEIRLNGSYLGSTKDGLELEVFHFVLPNGKSSHIKPKRKAIILQEVLPDYVGVGTVPTAQLKPGDFVTVVGKEDKGRFVARRVVVAARTEAEEKRRGSLFDAGEVKWIEDQSYPELSESASGSATFALKGGRSIVAPVASFIQDGSRTGLVTTINTFYQTEYPDLDAGPSQEQIATTTRQLQTIVGVKGLQSYSRSRDIALLTPPSVRVHTPFSGGEIIALPVTSAPTALPLATERPQRGDVVFLQEWYDISMWMRECTVLFADKDRLFLLAGSRGESARMPGSVITNKKGEVVGLQVGGGERYISGVSADAIRAAMQPDQRK